MWLVTTQWISQYSLMSFTSHLFSRKYLLHYCRVIKVVVAHDAVVVQVLLVQVVLIDNKLYLTLSWC